MMNIMILGFHMQKIIKWDVEKKCNLNCKHCRSGKQIRDNDLSLYEYIEIIHKLKN